MTDPMTQEDFELLRNLNLAGSPSHVVSGYKELLAEVERFRREAEVRQAALDVADALDGIVADAVGTVTAAAMRLSRFTQAWAMAGRDDVIRGIRGADGAAILAASDLNTVLDRLADLEDRQPLQESLDDANERIAELELKPAEREETALEHRSARQQPYGDGVTEPILPIDPQALENAAARFEKWLAFAAVNQPGKDHLRDVSYADYPIGDDDLKILLVDYRYHRPTEWAYLQACRALDKHRARADLAEGARDAASALLRRLLPDSEPCRIAPQHFETPYRWCVEHGGELAKGENCPVSDARNFLANQAADRESDT